MVSDQIVARRLVLFLKCGWKRDSVNYVCF